MQSLARVSPHLLLSTFVQCLAGLRYGLSARAHCTHAYNPIHSGARYGRSRRAQHLPPCAFRTDLRFVPSMPAQPWVRRPRLHRFVATLVAHAFFLCNALHITARRRLRQFTCLTTRSSGRLRVGCATIVLTRQPPLSSSVSAHEVFCIRDGSNINICVSWR